MTISELTECNDNCGEKGKNLKILTELFAGDAEVFVPETLVLPVELFRKIMRKNNVAECGDYRNIQIESRLENEILNAIHQKFGERNLVIRSSATCEDSIFFSGSGRYDSFLNIKSNDKIIEAIKKVYSSLFAENSRLYGEIYHVEMESEGMAVLIQPVAPVINAGVAFSCDPVTRERKYIIESTNGLGTAVVEGAGEINCLEIDHDAKNDANEKIQLLLNAIDKIRERFDFEVDIEWGFDDAGKLYIFQTRPIIFNDVKFRKKSLKAKRFQKCVPISKGFAIGKISEIEKGRRDEILHQDGKYKYDDFGLLLSSRGVITNQKSKLSHISNILRELAKPCVCAEDFCYDAKHLYVVDGFHAQVIDFMDLSDAAKIEAIFDYFEYLGLTVEVAYEKYNGILDVRRDNKFEEVVFDVDVDAVKTKFFENGFRENMIRQKIYTYDFDDDFLIRNQVILRIQQVDEKINIQLKLLDTSNQHYRKEKGMRILFENLNAAKRFAKSLNLVETGYQERTIKSLEKGNTSVNVIEWPGCEPYLGIEGRSLSDLNKINILLGLEQDKITGMGGKEIFEKLGLSIKDCEFKEKGKA